MLRISKIGGNVLKLEGRLVGRWVELLAEACRSETFGEDGVLTLDLSGVTIASKEGISLLQSLRDQGVKFVSCSPFLTELCK